MNHYDVTMDIHSNIITYCDVTIGYGEKNSIVHYMISTISSAQIGISTRDLDIEITFKTGHNTAYILYSKFNVDNYRRSLTTIFV